MATIPVLRGLRRQLRAREPRRAPGQFQRTLHGAGSGRDSRNVQFPRPGRAKSPKVEVEGDASGKKSSRQESSRTA